MRPDLADWVFSINVIELFSIIIFHWLADFVMQSNYQAQGKSKRWKPLLSHTLTYSSVMAVCVSFMVAIIDPTVFLDTIGIYISMVNFLLITFIFHTLTDYITSRINSYYWKLKKIHEFFVSIGFDQVLHYVQLYLTYHFIFQI